MDNSKGTVIILTGILFSTSYFIGVAEIIILCLSFLILMEIVRTIYEYTVNHNHRVKVRYVIDGSILFGVRELFVGWVMLKSTESFTIQESMFIPCSLLGLGIMIVSLISIGVLIFYRYKVIQSSPDILEQAG